MVDIAKAYFDDFLQGSGFSIPDDAPFEYKLSSDDFLAREEDFMWDDAFSAKFPQSANDGPVGAAGADVIKFPISDS